MYLIIFGITFYLSYLVFDFILERLIHKPKRFNINLIQEDYGTVLHPYNVGKKHVAYYIKIEPETNNNPNSIIIYSHGNSGNVYLCYKYCKLLADTLNITVVVYDYVGYGVSYAYPSEKMCYKSLKCLIEKLKTDDNHIYLIGRSLGTAVVVDFLSKNNWTNSVILISPLKSIFTLFINANIMFPLDKFNTYNKLKKVNCPLLIYHGVKDSIIPVSHTEDIMEYLFRHKKRINIRYLHEADHEDILSHIDMKEFNEYFLN